MPVIVYSTTPATVLSTTTKPYQEWMTPSIVAKKLVSHAHADILQDPASTKTLARIESKMRKMIAPYIFDLMCKKITEDVRRDMTAPGQPTVKDPAITVTRRILRALSQEVEDTDRYDFTQAPVTKQFGHNMSLFVWIERARDAAMYAIKRRTSARETDAEAIYELSIQWANIDDPEYYKIQSDKNNRINEERNTATQLALEAQRRKDAAEDEYRTRIRETKPKNDKDRLVQNLLNRPRNIDHGVVRDGNDFQSRETVLRAAWRELGGTPRSLLKAAEGGYLEILGSHPLKHYSNTIMSSTAYNSVVDYIVHDGITIADEDDEDDTPIVFHYQR